MATRPTVQQTVTKWQGAMAQAGPAWLNGVAGSADWAGNFINAMPQMIAGIQAAIADGRIGRHVTALGTTGWRAKVQAKGSAGLLAGAAAATNNATAGFTTLYGYLDSADQAIAGMPRGTRAQNIARSSTYQEAVGAASDAYKATH